MSLLTLVASLTSEQPRQKHGQAGEGSLVTGLTPAQALMAPDHPLPFLFPQSMHPAKSLQSCWTLCIPMDYGPSGSSVHGSSQATMLEWVAVSFSRRFSRPRNRTFISRLSCIGRWILYHLCHLRSPQYSSLNYAPCLGTPGRGFWLSRLELEGLNSYRCS